MATITGTGAVAGSEVRILTKADSGDAVLVQGTVKVDNAGNWAAQVQPAPTQEGTHLEAHIPKLDGDVEVLEFTLPDNQGGAVEDLIKWNANDENSQDHEDTEHVPTAAGTSEPADQETTAQGDITPGSTGEGVTIDPNVENKPSV